MPKTFNENERAVIKESMLNVGASLLRKKGSRQVSVEDITKGVNIAKGSFYSFYNSREELLWDIIKREERRVVEQFMSIASQDIDLKTKLRKIFYEVYLQEGSILYILPQEDVEYIVRKIPPETLKANFDYAYDINRSLLAACNLDESRENIEILITMEQILQMVISSDIPRSASAKKKVLGMLAEALVEYLSGGNAII